MRTGESPHGMGKKNHPTHPQQVQDETDSGRRLYPAARITQLLRGKRPQNESRCKNPSYQAMARIWAERWVDQTTLRNTVGSVLNKVLPVGA